MKYTADSIPRHCLAEVCQNCQSHKNKPSSCTLNDVSQNARYYGIGPIVYVPRKSEACTHFLNKYTGQGKA